MYYNFALQLWTCAPLTARTSSTASLVKAFTTVVVNLDFQVPTVTSILTTAAQIHASMESVSTASTAMTASATKAIGELIVKRRSSKKEV